MRTDGGYIDLEDLLSVIYANEHARKLLCAWKKSCTGQQLRELIATKGGEFGPRMYPLDIVTLKWMNPSPPYSSTGRPRVACTTIGACVVLTLVRSSRNNPNLEMAIAYFHELARRNKQIDVMHAGLQPVVYEAGLPLEIRELLSMPHKPLLDFDSDSELPMQLKSYCCNGGRGDERTEEGEENDDTSSIFSKTTVYVQSEGGETAEG